MNAPHPHLETDWQGVAMSLADVNAPEVLAVISHHTSAVLTITHGANGAGKEQAAL